MHTAVKRAVLVVGTAMMFTGLAGQVAYLDGEEYQRFNASLTMGGCGFAILGASFMARLFDRNHSSQDEAYKRGYSMGHDSGYREGRRVARPVVVPIRRDLETILDTVEDVDELQRHAHPALYSRIPPEGAVSGGGG